MTKKRHEVMERLESILPNMEESELEKLLWIGEGMVVMSHIKEGRTEPEKKAG